MVRDILVNQRESESLMHWLLADDEVGCKHEFIARQHQQKLVLSFVNTEFLHVLLLETIYDLVLPN